MREGVKEMQNFNSESLDEMMAKNFRKTFSK